MTRFRPCIDLHAGQVKQIVGGTLSHTPQPPSSSSTTNDPTTAAISNDSTSNDAPPTQTELVTNHTSSHPASHFAQLYRTHDLTGAHVIMLGPGNEDAAREALAAWPGGLQVGGGINDGNAMEWLDAGASHVILTSYLFPSGEYSGARLASLLEKLGERKDKLVIDLSCRRRDPSLPHWYVATNKWTQLTSFELTRSSLHMLASSCAEFLIHAASKEGLQGGIDEELVEKLGEWCSEVQIPVTYAGGARSVGDLELVKRLSGGWVDLTVGSALDIFGGEGMRLNEGVEWNRRGKEGPVKV